MCQTPTDVTTCTKPTAPARFCRWPLGEEASRALLQAGHPTPLYMVTTTKAGPIATEYFVYRVEGGWKLLKEEKGQVVERYFIDCSFDENPDFWLCDCPQARWKGVRCKHVLGLLASVRKLGMLNV